MSRSRGFVSFKQKTAYEMRISDWSSDECSSDLPGQLALGQLPGCGNGLFHGLIQADVSIQIVPKLPVAYAAYRWQAGVQIGPFMQCAHLFNQPQLQHGPITLRNTCMQRKAVGWFQADGNELPRVDLPFRPAFKPVRTGDRKSKRLNSSH